jgi:hypothetical protein
VGGGEGGPGGKFVKSELDPLTQVLAKGKIANLDPAAQGLAENTFLCKNDIWGINIEKLRNFVKGIWVFCRNQAMDEM